VTGVFRPVHGAVAGAALLSLLSVTAARGQAGGTGAVAVDSAHPITGMVMPRRSPPRYYTGFSWSRQNLDAPVVTRVADDSPAARAGIAAGDVILAVGDLPTTGHTGLFPDGAPGRRYALHVRRGEEEMELEIVLAPPRPVEP
jgi:S1-C subfamily serine protease